MKRYLGNVLCYAAALALVVCASSQCVHATPIGGQFLVDDFESGLGSWFAEGGTGSAAISSDAFAGSGALEAGYAADFHGARINIPLAPEDRFSEIAIGFVYKESSNSASSGPGLRAALVEFGPGGVSFHNGDFLFASTSWQAGPANVFTLNRADADSLALIIQGHSTPGGGTVLVDNLTLTKVGPPVPEPTSICLATITLIGTLIVRKRSL